MALLTRVVLSSESKAPRLFPSRARPSPAEKPHSWASGEVLGDLTLGPSYIVPSSTCLPHPPAQLPPTPTPHLSPSDSEPRRKTPGQGHVTFYSSTVPGKPQTEVVISRKPDLVDAETGRVQSHSGQDSSGPWSLSSLDGKEDSDPLCQLAAPSSSQGEDRQEGQM